MRKPLVVLSCVASILLFPAFVSHNTAISYPVPFQTEALAGHSAANGLLPCDCGAIGCICDPGEQIQTVRATSTQSSTAVSNKGLTSQPPAPDTEPVLAGLILALLFTVILRMR